MPETLRETADALGLNVTSPYRVGIGWELHCLRADLGRRHWRGVRRSLYRLLRRLRLRADWGLWQCEGDLCRFARRGLTARAAERRMLTDEIGEALGQRTRHQAQKWARASVLDQTQETP